ncbi:MAG: hypothetical protein JW785_00470 [Acidimicrobiia bacterium]|nr:hypothetical protein [Acidimicrobiia bacterium]
MDQHEQHEEFEQIPWSELTTRPPEGRRRVLYLAAGGVGALVITVLVVRAFLSPSGVAPVAPAPAVSVEEVAATTAAVTATSAAVAASPAPALLYREADLMAFPAAPAERAAVARAEWFVTDYFTADLEPTGSADLRAALPGGAAIPDMPQDAAGSLSYVEWARAFRVEEVGEGRFRVGVAFRALGAPPDRGFYRLPVRAVEVTVAVGDDGGTTVVDLPAPTPLPAGPEPEAWPQEEGEAPQWVIDAAVADAGSWGTETRLLAAYEAEAGWRVVLTLADDVGNRWPVVVWVESGADATGG